MSQENVEAMRTGVERFNRGGEDDAILDALYDEDAVFRSRSDEPDTGVYRGREAIRAMMRMWRDTFDAFEFDVAEYIDCDDVLVLAGWVRVRARGSTAEVREPYAWVARMQDATVREISEYHSRGEALKAAGLTE